MAIAAKTNGTDLVFKVNQDQTLDERVFILEGTSSFWTFFRGP